MVIIYKDLAGSWINLWNRSPLDVYNLNEHHSFYYQLVKLLAGSWFRERTQSKDCGNSRAILVYCALFPGPAAIVHTRFQMCKSMISNVTETGKFRFLNALVILEKSGSPSPTATFPQSSPGIRTRS